MIYQNATAYNDIEFTEEKYIANIIISDSVDTDDPWILVTNGNSKRAIKDYSYRFGGIESVLKTKNQMDFILKRQLTVR